MQINPTKLKKFNRRSCQFLQIYRETQDLCIVRRVYLKILRQSCYKLFRSEKYFAFFKKLKNNSRNIFKYI
uniref:Uncharacterized protein n=1 Tax=Meloidogyne enterolobii TaxID=390850 RepID=A0A6V7UD50_MELEN|nr:unnamed protein product [Meloidogyne enterolobii]